MLAQFLAVAIFIIMFVMVILEKIERQIITLVCGLLTLVVVFGLVMHDTGAIIDTLNVNSIFTIDFWYEAGDATESSSGINWATIIFIASMMVMVEGMTRVGFFRWLCMKIANMVHYKIIPIFFIFMLMSAFLSMFIASITVILFLAAVTVELAQLLKFNPVPMILAEIFCSNLGGSATMCGDPPNLIIGTSLGYSFGDFIFNTGVMALVALVFVLIYFYIVFHKELTSGAVVELAPEDYPNPADAITDKKGFVISTVIFLLSVVLLITHSMTGLTVAFIGLLIAVLTLITAPRHAVSMLKRIDYKTVLFFIGLFVVVGGLEQTGILVIVADFISKVSNGSTTLMIAIIIWVSAIASAFIDNIPFAATMIPVIKTLSTLQGVDLQTLAWALTMGTDIGGSGTPIGASANVVGTSVAAKEGYPIGWGRYCKKVVPATILVLLISTIMIFVRYL